MCGIAGLVGSDSRREVVVAMTRQLEHRGPDGRGFYEAPDGDPPVFLGHTRLSIIDLVTGDQPMSDGAGELWLVYNGEIYNFPDLRTELEELGHRFRTSSDSEVIVEGYRAWGLDLLPRLDGMFAFALWDAPRRRLVLARDVFGIKPLHYHFDGKTLCFASEIKAILQNPGVPRQVDFQALHWFLNLRYVPGERTLFDGVRRVPPGHALIFENGRPRLERYLEIEASAEPRRDAAYYVEGIRHYLREAVRKQLLADVPLGVYLSGGLDSSSLVAFVSELSGEPVRTFSLGFGEPTDELADARRVADHFGTLHHEMTIDPEPLRHFPAVVWATEEPKENILQGYLLARFARREVKAVLGGLGGDEIFAGYMIHRFLYPSDRAHRLVPQWLRRTLLEPASRAVFRLQNATGLRRFDEYRRAVQLLLSAGDPCRYYLGLRNAWDYDRGAFQIYGPAWKDHPVELTHTAFDGRFEPRAAHILDLALRAEMSTKMVDDFLLNEDRTSMASGLEVRVPFLDRDLVRFAMGIPVDLKMRGNNTKALFREAMAPYLPGHTLAKAKQGFSFDPHQQFRKDLKTAAERVLTRRRVESRGWLDYAYLRRILDHPPHPRLRWHYFQLWLALGLEIWARMFLDGTPRDPDLELESYF